MEAKIKKWLSEKAFPLWLTAGVDPNGGFFESLDFATAEPQWKPRRTMVQARQIYCFAMGLDLKLCESELANEAIEKGEHFLLNHCLQKNGSFVHSVSPQGEISDGTPDLYAQAFALFGLGVLFKKSQQKELCKKTALSLHDYLISERRLSSGGFSERNNSETLWESNPHMHLFEAALLWREVDDSPVWEELCQEIFQLFENKLLIEGCVAEHFSEGWEPQRDSGQFAYEPGHHHEWAWLLQKWNPEDTLSLSMSLFEKAEEQGIDPKTGMCFDEVWSDGTVKTSSHRFWPQCERIKAALSLQKWKEADQAVEALFRFFETPVEGGWYDVYRDGKFVVQDIKASSFYHIVNALTEYLITPRV